MDAHSRKRLLANGLRLEYVTLGWNVVGVVIALWAASTAKSVALVGFGLDSLIEIAASIIVVWQLTGVDAHREQRALRLMGAVFFALAMYVLVQASYVLTVQLRSSPSPVGMAWLTLTAIVMLALAYGKHVTGERLENPVLLTEARVTLVDAILAFAVLIGLALNAGIGWWWGDPIAALVVVYYGFREGLHAWNKGA